MRATIALILINVAVYVWVWLTGGYNANSTDPNLLAHGALYGPLVTEYGQWWRIVTSAFLHAGLLHIALNMFALYQVGSFVEAIGGTRKFLFVYFVSMLGAGLSAVVFSYDTSTVGASGAIFGLFGALVAIGLRLGSRGRTLIAQALPIILINLGFTFTVANISAAEHVGGLITGFLVALAVYGVRRPAAAPVSPAEMDPAEIEGDRAQ